MSRSSSEVEERSSITGIGWTLEKAFEGWEANYWEASIAQQ